VFSAASDVIWACTVRIAANINDVDDLVRSQDNDQAYNLVLFLKEDSMNMLCDFLMLTVMLLHLSFDCNFKTLHH